MVIDKSNRKPEYKTEKKVNCLKGRLEREAYERI